MLTIPMILLANKESPATRAYLVYLAKNNYKLKKILLIDACPIGRKGLLVRKYLGDFLTFKLTRCYKAMKSVRKNKHNQLLKEYSDAVQSGFPFKIDYFGDLDYHEYAESVEAISIKSLEDDRFIDVLKKQSCSDFIYGGGLGIVPAKTLDTPGIRFLHVHPGIVPYVRGSDGLFWSLLVRGRPGVSCFFMDSGIDTGNLLGTKEFDPPSFKFSSKTIDYDTLYAALLLAYDPHLRANLLVDVLKHQESVGFSFDLIKEQPRSGRTFFKMHRKLRDILFDSLCTCNVEGPK